MMSSARFIETKYLKKHKFGPPGNHPQEHKQKEDELTSVNVKQGFINPLPVPYESKSVKHHANLDRSKHLAEWATIKCLKMKKDTFVDSGKKRPQIFRERFLPISMNNPKSRSKLHEYFKLLAGSTLLSTLAEKERLPIIQKKEDILYALAEYQVPWMKATWFIKMTSAYNFAPAETKMKKRVNGDPFIEWTQAFCKFLGELIERMSISNHADIRSQKPWQLLASGATVDFQIGDDLGTISNVLHTSKAVDRPFVEKLYSYTRSLCNHMLAESLLDRQEFYSWVVEQFEDLHESNFLGLVYMLPMIQIYTKDMCNNQLLARRFAFCICNQILHKFSIKTTSKNYFLQSSYTNKREITKELRRRVTFDHPLGFSICWELVYSLFTIIIECPGALIHYPLQEPTASPLEWIPCDAWLLPTPLISREHPDRITAEKDLRMVKSKSLEIRSRSDAAVSRWNEYEDSDIGVVSSWTLETLEVLDKQHYDKGEPLQQLYTKIFASPHNNSSQTIGVREKELVLFLCQWAVTSERMGVVRTYVIVKLLQLRQQHFDKLQPVKDRAVSVPFFQLLLHHYLDLKAPSLSDPKNDYELESFENLIFFFSELISHEVFSYSSYLNTLITRADFSPDDIVLPFTLQSDHSSNIVTGLTNPGSNFMDLSTTPTASQNPFSKLDNKELDSSRVDLAAQLGLDPSAMESAPLDLDPFSIDSSGDRHFTDAVRTVGESTGRNKRKLVTNPSLDTDGQQLWGYGQPKHAQYVMHFPICFDDVEGNPSGWNERLMMLYGPVRHRNVVKKSVKKLIKHLSRLIKGKSEFSRNDRINSWSQPPARKRRRDASKFICSQAELINKFRTMPYFDRQAVISHGLKTLTAVFNRYITRQGYLPTHKIVTLLFDLVEETLNISAIMETCVEILGLMPKLIAASEKEDQLATSGGDRAVSRDHLNKASDRQWYFSELTRDSIALLSLYRQSLILDSDLTILAFKHCWKLLQMNPHFTVHSQTNSTEKRMMSLLCDLYPFTFVKKEFSESFQPSYSIIKQIQNGYTDASPECSNTRYDPDFLSRFIDDPKSESPLVVAQQHSDSLRDDTNRYSFVCSVITAVCSMDEQLDKVIALSTLCSEINSRCPKLISDWLGVLQALCYSNSAYYSDVQMRVEAGNSKIRDPLALFLAVLISRNCISLGGFIAHVAMRSLLGCSNRNSATSFETGARLTCHLLLRLFKAPHFGAWTPKSNEPIQALQMLSFADRHLMAVEHEKIQIGAILAVLKGMLKLSSGENKRARNRWPFNPAEVNRSAIADDVDDLFPAIDTLDSFDELVSPSSSISAPNSQGTNRRMNRNLDLTCDSTKVSEFAKKCVRELCCQRWVCERSIKQPEMDLLMDNVLTRSQRRNLIQLLCYPEDQLERLKEFEANPKESWDTKDYVASIISDMNVWSLRKRVLELEVMMRQDEVEKIAAEQIARATIEVFQRRQLQSTSSDVINTNRQRKQIVAGKLLDGCNEWLIPPLISELSSFVLASVLQEASAILEAPHNWTHNNLSPSTSSQTRSGSRASGTPSSDHCIRNQIPTDFTSGAADGSSLLNNQSFLVLILTCLKGQDEQRETLLDSLKSQLTMLLSEWQTSSQNKQELTPPSRNSALHKGLKLRLTLFGGMFDTIENNNTLASEVVVLLTRLIAYGIVDIIVNPDLFYTVYDMIGMLLHNTASGGAVSKRTDGNKRDYTNMVKRMKKELTDRQTMSVHRLQQLLPIPRRENWVICFEHVGGSGGSDSSKSLNSIASENKQGLTPLTKVKVNPWEIIEGLPSMAPLCISWFGASTEPKKVPYYETQHIKLRNHNHVVKKNLWKEFLKPPLLPPEEEVSDSPNQLPALNQIKNIFVNDAEAISKNAVIKATVASSNKPSSVIPINIREPISTSTSTMVRPKPPTRPKKNKKPRLPAESKITRNLRHGVLQPTGIGSMPSAAFPNTQPPQSIKNYRPKPPKMNLNQESSNYTSYQPNSKVRECLETYLFQRQKNQIQRKQQTPPSQAYRTVIPTHNQQQASYFQQTPHVSPHQRTHPGFAPQASLHRYGNPQQQGISYTNTAAPASMISQPQQPYIDQQPQHSYRVIDRYPQQQQQQQSSAANIPVLTLHQTQNNNQAYNLNRQPQQQPQYTRMPQPQQQMINSSTPYQILNNSGQARINQSQPNLQRMVSGRGTRLVNQVTQYNQHIGSVQQAQTNVQQANMLNMRPTNAPPPY